MPTHPPDPIEDVPRHTDPGTGWTQRLAASFLRLGGWTLGDPPPRLDKYVVVAAPHTQWWDGFWMLCFAWWWGLRVNWMAKNTIMRWPFAGLLRRTGVVPVDRSAPRGLVGQIVDEFERRDRMVLSIPPEGTRGRREFWKSGFYHIAHQAGVPVCLSYLDYGRRVAGFGPCMTLTGDIAKDMDRVREFYADIEGKVPENFTPPRLREELEDAAHDDDAAPPSVEDAKPRPEPARALDR